MPNLKNEEVDQFKASLRGPLLGPGDAGYDVARTIWNAMIDRRPALIVRCAGVADVMRSIAFARDHELLLAVRGGGHNIAGNAVCDGGLMLDMSLMRSARIDLHERHAYVDAGCTLADFDHEAQAFGLATPLGINSTTGVAGLTLGGGFGWLSRKYGLTVDNLIAAEVVTADGERRWASADHEPDLFWAIRGGGGNFGVVTLFQFQLHEVGPQIFGGLVVFPHEQAKSVLSQYRDFVGRLPQDLSVWAVLRQAPLGSYLGWNITASGFDKGKICQLAGAYVPFAKTKAERVANHDRRPSLEERYGTHAAYVDAVKKAAAQAVVERFLLPADAARLVAEAEASDVLK